VSTTKEEVLFGYGKVGGKGLVLCYLTNKVGGVRRARAVVHARTVASMFSVSRPHTSQEHS
jgi:hypothetical protein